MQVKVNDVEIDVDAGSTVEDVIKLSNAPYIEGSAIALIEGRQELESHVNKYKISTTQGSIIIELVEDAEILTDFWKNNYKEFISKAIKWTSSHEAAMGSIVSE